MFASSLFVVVMMLLFPAGQQPDNVWKDKVPDALARAQARGTVPALREAFDIAWRADDWQAGLKLAGLASEKAVNKLALRGRIVRALWRSGHISEAEALAAEIPADTTDNVALRMLIAMHLTRGENEKARRMTAALAARSSNDVEDLYQVFGTRLALNELEGVADLIRAAQRLTDPAHGYPETFVAEALDGVAEFLDAIGTQPLNQVTQHGAAPMPPLVLLSLPSCQVMINGHGPYRMVVDTGGSIMLSLDETVAAEIGLKSIAKATVRGVSGKMETGQCLIDELRIGGIKCRRVMTRTFDVRGAIMNAADGIIGTGIFAHDRLRLDFADGQLIVSPSRAEAGPGREVDLRLVADAKLMVPVTLEGQPAVALLDTGADAVAVSPSRLRSLFPDREIKKFDTGLALGVGSGKGPEISLGAGVELDFAGRKFKNYGGLGLDVLDDVLSPGLGMQTDILIGMPTFRRTKSCTIDYQRCRMWIDWLPGE